MFYCVQIFGYAKYVIGIRVSGIMADGRNLDFIGIDAFCYSIALSQSKSKEIPIKHRLNCEMENGPLFKCICVVSCF